MLNPSWSADEEPANTRPIVAPLLLQGRGPRKGVSFLPKHETSDSIRQPP